MTAPAGIGKTRLAVALGAELAAEFQDAAWLVDLAPIRDPELVPSAMARALRVQEDGGTRSWRRSRALWRTGARS